MEIHTLLPPTNPDFIKKANQSIPTLHTLEETPQRVIRAERDEASILGWRAVELEREAAWGDKDMGVLGPGDSVILDFGELILSFAWSGHGYHLAYTSGKGDWRRAQMFTDIS
jgi:hypothetical protein